MVDVNDDAKAGFRRIEILTGPGRRRRWSAEEKARIIAETLEPGARVSEIARRWQVCPQQVFGWRRQARLDLSGSRTEPAACSLPPFVPLVAAAAPTAKVAVPTPASAVIEIKLAGAAVAAGWSGRPVPSESHSWGSAAAWRCRAHGRSASRRGNRTQSSGCGSRHRSYRSYRAGLLLGAGESFPLAVSSPCEHWGRSGGCNQRGKRPLRRPGVHGVPAGWAPFPHAVAFGGPQARALSRAGAG